jgi:hypothetical protein
MTRDRFPSQHLDSSHLAERLVQTLIAFALKNQRMLRLDIGAQGLDRNLLFTGIITRRKKPEGRESILVINNNVIASLATIRSDQITSAHSEFLRQDFPQETAQGNFIFCAKLKVVVGRDIPKQVIKALRHLSEIVIV